MNGKERTGARVTPGQIRGMLLKMRRAIAALALISLLLSSLGLFAPYNGFEESGALGVSAAAHSHAGDCEDEPGVRHCHTQVAQTRHAPSVVVIRVERTIARVFSSDRMPRRLAIPPLPKPPRNRAA